VGSGVVREVVQHQMVEIPAKTGKIGLQSVVATSRYPNSCPWKKVERHMVVGRVVRPQYLTLQE
jgi:hypothetical protein